MIIYSTTETECAEDMNGLRRSCRVFRIDKINEEIRQSVHQRDTVVESLEIRDLQWYKHIRSMC